MAVALVAAMAIANALLLAASYLGRGVSTWLLSLLEPELTLFRASYSVIAVVCLINGAVRLRNHDRDRAT